MKDRVLLITGGAGHIGRAVCEKAAAQGSHIAVLDKNTEAAADLARDLSRKFGVKGHAVSADLMDPASFAEIQAQMDSDFGRVDFLVNNAAFYDDMPGWGVPFDQEGYDAWMAVMRVNLLAPFFLTQALHGLMTRNAGGAVVNVSSIYGVVGPDHGIYEGTEMTNPAAYAASKGGLTQLTRWLSTVLAPDIRVNTVTPGGVERGQDEEFVARYHKKTPLGRMAREEDIAEAVLFLLSPKSGYITGQNLLVDGGWTVW